MARALAAPRHATPTPTHPMLPTHTCRAHPHPKTLPCPVHLGNPLLLHVLVQGLLSATSFLTCLPSHSAFCCLSPSPLSWHLSSCLVSIPLEGEAVLQLGVSSTSHGPCTWQVLSNYLLNARWAPRGDRRWRLRASPSAGLAVGSWPRLPPRLKSSRRGGNVSRTRGYSLKRQNSVLYNKNQA